ncbi:MAG TPA: hypothetical protein VK509_21295 [Polyangiales bacterium]|nr:hypothetical protein [Polyangiales bacterium]
MRTPLFVFTLALFGAAGTAVHAQPSAQAQPSDAQAPAAATVASDTAPATAAPSQLPAAEDPAARAKRIEHERANMQAMLARAREAHRQRDQVEEREPDPVHGDAGAAFALGLSFDAPWYDDPGYDVFSEEDSDVAGRLGLWVAYDFASLSDDVIAAVELGWGHESAEGRVLDVAETKLTTNVAYAGATMRWVPLSWLQPHLRLAGGAAIVDARLVAANETFHDGAGGVFEDMISPYGSAGLGFSLRTPTRMFENRRGRFASLSFGLMVEGGYTLAAPVDVALEGPKASARDIPVAEPALGELERSGPYIRVSLVGRL